MTVWWKQPWSFSDERQKYSCHFSHSSPTNVNRIHRERERKTSCFSILPDDIRCFVQGARNSQVLDNYTDENIYLHKETIVYAFAQSHFSFAWRRACTHISPHRLFTCTDQTISYCQSRSGVSAGMVSDFSRRKKQTQRRASHEPAEKMKKNTHRESWSETYAEEEWSIHDELWSLTRW